MRTLYWACVALCVGMLAYVAGYSESGHKTAESGKQTAILAIRDTIHHYDTVRVVDSAKMQHSRIANDDRLARNTYTTPMPDPDSGTTVPTLVVPLDTVTAILTEERAVCDTAIAHLKDQVQNFKRLDSLLKDVPVEHVGRMRVRDRFGVSLGYGMTLSNGLVRVGPVVSVGVKVWP